MGDDDEPVSESIIQSYNELVNSSIDLLRQQERERSDAERIEALSRQLRNIVNWNTEPYASYANSVNFSNSSLKYVNNKFKICAYFTLNTPYEKVIYESFVKSKYFEEISNELVYFKGYENQGTWTANTALKPKFILETLQKFSNYEYFLFIDADSQVMRRPDLLYDLMKTKVDIAFHRLDWQNWYRNGIERKELLSGSLFIRNCQEIKALCQDWYLRSTSTNMWEQKVLENILETKKYNLTISELPVEYCYINSMPDGSEPFVKVENPVIVHYQASRKFRREINE